MSPTAGGRARARVAAGRGVAAVTFAASPAPANKLPEWNEGPDGTPRDLEEGLWSPGTRQMRGLETVK